MRYTERFQFSQKSYFSGWLVAQNAYLFKLNEFRNYSKSLLLFHQNVSHWSHYYICIRTFQPTAAENRGEHQPLSMPAAPSVPPLLSPCAEDVEAVPRPRNIAVESV